MFDHSLWLTTALPHRSHPDPNSAHANEAKFERLLAWKRNYEEKFEEVVKNRTVMHVGRIRLFPRLTLICFRVGTASKRD